jgi:hypothetical protein
MLQTWHDLLFAHWPVPAEALAPLLPAGLPPETFDGRAWIGVVPFRMSGVRPRGLPALPRVSAFPELNVRTYVTRDGRPGVWFFSLDAAEPIAVAAARRLFHLPYFSAAMRCECAGDWIDYSSRRVPGRHAPATFRARYRPTGPAFTAARGGLEHWLTERYCLYTADPKGRIHRGEIHHAPWPLRPAEAEIAANTMADALAAATLPSPRGGTPRTTAVPLVGSPHLLFAERLDTVVWGIEKA